MYYDFKKLFDGFKKERALSGLTNLQMKNDLTTRFVDWLFNIDGHGRFIKTNRITMHLRIFIIITHRSK